MAETAGAIYTAAGANLAIAAAKFVGASLTGSTAMLAEGAHAAAGLGPAPPGSAVPA
ncbi:MAG: hypothetical protein PGN25_01455 [Methylorubrum populi]